MFNPFDIEDRDLDAAIASAFVDLKSFSAEDEGYQKATDQLSKLYALKHNVAQLNLQAQQSYATHQLAEDQRVHQDELDERPFYQRINPDTVLVVAGNLFLGLAVIKYEQTGVISSKVMSFMKKI